MNRELEIRERVALYGLELTGHDREALDIARGNLEFYAYSDLRYLLSETARLRAELEAFRATGLNPQEIQHWKACLSVPTIKHVFEMAERIEKERDTLKAELEAMTAERDAAREKRPLNAAEFDAAMQYAIDKGLVVEKRVAQAELDAAQKRAEAAERDLTAAVRYQKVCETCLFYKGGFCTENSGGRLCGVYRKWEWRGPDAEGNTTTNGPSTYDSKGGTYPR